jgi:hypothetical protein
MVESPLVIGDQVVFESQAFGFLRGSRRRVFNFIKRFWEAVEIVDGSSCIYH